MTEKNIILGLNSFNCKSKISNANWENKMIEPITILQGDSITVRNCLLDTRTNNTTNIVIPNDVEISLEYYFYFINRGGNQSPSPFTTELQIPGEPLVQPLVQTGMFDFLNCLNYGTSDSKGYISAQIISPNEIGIIEFSRSADVATATLIPTSSIIPLSSSGTVIQTSTKIPQPAVSFDADNITIQSTTFVGGSTTFTYPDPGPDEGLIDGGNIVGYFYSNNKLLPTPSCPNLGTTVPLVESIMYPDFTNGINPNNPPVVSGIPNVYVPTTSWNIGEDVEVKINIEIYPDVLKVTDIGWYVTWSPFTIITVSADNVNTDVNMTVGNAYVFQCDSISNPILNQITVGRKFTASWSGQTAAQPVVVGVQFDGIYAYLQVVGLEAFTFGVTPTYTSITFTQTALGQAMVVTETELINTEKAIKFTTDAVFDPEAFSGTFYFTQIKSDITSLCNLNNFCIPMNVTSGDGLPYLAYMNQSEVDSSGNPTGVCNPTKRVPIKKKWKYLLKAGSYTQNELATTITRSMATQKQKIQRKYWLDNQLSIATTPTDGINKQYRGLPPSVAIPYDPNNPPQGTSAVPVPIPFIDNFNAYQNGAYTDGYPKTAYNPSRYYLSKNPKAYPPPSGINELHQLSPDYNTKIDEDDQPFLFRPTAYAKPNPFFVPQTGGGIDNGIIGIQEGNPNPMTSGTAYTGAFTVLGTAPNGQSNFVGDMNPYQGQTFYPDGSSQPDMFAGSNFSFNFFHDTLPYPPEQMVGYSVIIYDYDNANVLSTVTQFKDLPVVNGGSTSAGLDVITFVATENFIPAIIGEGKYKLWNNYTVDFIWLGDTLLDKVIPPNWVVDYVGVGPTYPLVTSNTQNIGAYAFEISWVANSNLLTTADLSCNFFIPAGTLNPSQQPNYLYSAGMCYNDSNLFKWNQMQGNNPLVDVYFSPFLTDCFSPFFQNQIRNSIVNTGNLIGPSNFYGIRPVITQQLEYIIYNQVSIDPSNNDVIETPTLQYSPNYEVVCPLVGASQMSLIYNPDDNLFQLNYMHTPLYIKPTAGSNAVQESVGIYPSYYYPFPPDQAGLKSPPQGVFMSDKQSGIILSDMQPRNFWELLGFNVDECIANPPDNNRGESFMTFEEFLKKTTGGFSGSANSFNAKIDMVGTAEQCYASAPDTYSVGGAINLPPTNGQQITATVFQNSYDLSPIYYEVNTTNSLNAAQISLQDDDCGHYVIEITAYNSEFLNDNEKAEVKAIVNNYFISANSFLTTNGQDAYVYYHQGEPINISNLKIRILNPKTLEEVKLLGPNNSLYLQITKQIFKPTFENINTNQNSQVPFS